jgi:hypothetical protein
LTGRPAHFERKIEIAADLGNPLYFLFRALAIPGFQQGKKQLVGDRLVAGDTEQAFRRVGPLQRLGRKIEIPEIDGSRFACTCDPAGHHVASPYRRVPAQPILHENAVRKAPVRQTLGADSQFCPTPILAQVPACFPPQPSPE